MGDQGESVYVKWEAIVGILFHLMSDVFFGACESLNLEISFSL